MVPFVILCKVLLTFKQVDESLLCDHSYESYLEVLSLPFSLSFNAIRMGPDAMQNNLCSRFGQPWV